MGQLQQGARVLPLIFVVWDGLSSTPECKRHEGARPCLQVTHHQYHHTGIRPALPAQWVLYLRPEAGIHVMGTS